MTGEAEDIMAKQAKIDASGATSGPAPETAKASARSPVDKTRELAGKAVKTSAVLLEEEARLARDLMAVLAGNSEIAPAPGDKRFKDDAWNQNPFLRIAMQGYLSWTQALGQVVDQIPLDDRNRERARFAVSMLSDAFAPTNTLLGNPAALKKMVDTGGSSIARGLKNMLTDLATNKGMPAQVDKSKFRVGENLATTPGAVVFRNPVLELIQYTPTTEKVHARPQIMVPPQINKYYIFDLAPGKSIVEFLVGSGFQVFTVSWRNPTADQADWDMATYVSALLEAIEAVREITGADDVNLHGACSGAMTMAAMLGHLAASERPLVHAATMMVAVLDGQAESQLGLFATPEVVSLAKTNSASRGVIEGHDMGRVFAWMRPNDLVWNYWVNNYLMGNPPPAFDVLYWNNDTTRLPARFHAQLMDIFAEHQLSAPGGMTMLDTPIDLSRVKCDTYVLAGISDHITPWQGVFNTSRTLGGKNEFVLSSSGHVQSLINPPGNPKAKYFTNGATAGTADDWLAGATAVQGTWWEHWREWLKAHSGKLRAAPAALGSKAHPPAEPAPGTYVVAA
ncbi:alpha/beta fold hydrolase [Thauera sp. WH-1]|uniref:alpha/beta fold hydrolase n=1 Tax=Thauera sp. WH-1 TaxID=3398230 RepID=UPI0039FCC789